MVRGQLSVIERSKLVALITMEIHNRDVMDRMIRASCSSVQDFEWLSQLRFIFAKDQGPYGLCSVRQTNSTLEYSYEYQGNNGRLVVTPLTDRCVLTLTTAMYLNRGGNPLGPAGTGKTETVKDLGKNLAKYVVVINCSDGQDYKSVGRIFSGLVQSGSWGCFDEFNRIKIEVISVVAMQVRRERGRLGDYRGGEAGRPVSGEFFTNKSNHSRVFSVHSR
jgi:dynein heavy chain